jgi:hypothetical protein
MHSHFLVEFRDLCLAARIGNIPSGIRVGARRKMKQTLKNAMRPASRFVRQFIRDSVAIERVAPDRESCNQLMQRSIVNQYMLCKLNKTRPYQKIGDAGFRVHSQFEEDGIILYVLSMIGFKTKRVVEMCCGGGNECMATNLVLNHGFDGYLFDGSAENIHHAQTFFASKPDCVLYPPVLTEAWITTHNVNDLLTKSGCAGEVDLFSLDVDGNDYWIWNAIDAINPRLLLFETHNVIPADKSLTIKYQPDFDCWSNPLAAQDYRGASLLAIQKLCKRRGYRMIGGHRHGFNVFFLREDEGIEFFPEVSIQEVQDNHWTRWSQANRWPQVKDMPWQEV